MLGDMKAVSLFASILVGDGWVTNAISRTVHRKRHDMDTLALSIIKALDFPLVSIYC